MINNTIHQKELEAFRRMGFWSVGTLPVPSPGFARRKQKIEYFSDVMYSIHIPRRASTSNT